MEEKYTKEDIQLAIDMCPKHIVKCNAPPEINGNLDCEIETIEWGIFTTFFATNTKIQN
jgi:hypothetical protein